MFGWLFKKEQCECKEPVFEQIENKSRYRSANPFYYRIVDENGVAYLFTKKDLDSAIKRASKNPEDIS